jgi:hypothetical protein
MSLGLTFLKPLLVPVVRFFIGKFLTQASVENALTVVFADLDQITSKLPTQGVLWKQIEANVDKAGLAAEILTLLESQL